ncbi:hypothetical protein IJO12_08860 [bacterium]|nr:hypothetical protein [bacterium]
MAPTVEQNTSITDASGYFHVGSKRGETKFKGIYNLFFNENKIFNRIDQNWDGVLSNDEIISELKDYIYFANRSRKWAEGAALLSSFLAYKGVNKRFNIALTIINGINIIYSYCRQKTAENMLEKARKEAISVPEDTLSTESNFIQVA